MTTDDTGLNKFATPSDCLKIITDIEWAMLILSQDRALIDGQFNGSRPFSAQEEKEFQIQVNANFLEGYRMAQSAILQVNGALLYKDRFYNFRCLKGKKTKRQEWGEKFTNNFHKPLKRGKSGKKYFYLMQNRNAALTLHGIGALWWPNDYCWMPRFVPLDDLLIPTETPLEMSEELAEFGVNSWLTAWQLFEMTQLEKRDKGWNQTMAMDLLRSLTKACNFTPDYYDKPEKLESLWKQRSTYLNSDAVPKLKITTFYHQDTANGKWWRKVLVRENQGVGIGTSYNDQFLYEGTKPFADSIDHIIQIQFGDGSVVAPYKYRSVRGLGQILFSLVELMNRYRCQVFQGAFSDLTPLLRVENPTDRDRPRMLQMQPYSVVSNGVSFVPREERHQPNYQLVDSVMSQTKQLMSENSASYIQDIDNGTQKEQTLGEAQIKIQSANKLISSMLMCAYEQEVFLGEEELRRFLLPTSTDPDVVAFKERCRADGIPDDLMVVEAWQTEVTRSFGAGDQTLAQQEVTALLNLAPQLDPSAQRTIKRQYVSVMTRNPDLAEALVPEEPETVTSGSKAAEDVFATLMDGVEVGLREGVEQTDYVQTMMRAMGTIIQRINTTDEMGTPQEVLGLQTVANDVQNHLQLLSQDPTEKQFVTAASKELGAMMNYVKAYAQRQQEKGAQQNPDPETMAKIQNDQMVAQSKQQNSDAAAQQKLEQKQATFELKMNQDQQKFTIQMQQMMEKGMAELEAMKVQTMADLAAQAAKTTGELHAQKAKAKAASTSKEATNANK